MSVSDVVASDAMVIGSTVAGGLQKAVSALGSSSRSVYEHFNCCLSILSFFFFFSFSSGRSFVLFYFSSFHFSFHFIFFSASPIPIPGFAPTVSG